MKRGGFRGYNSDDGRAKSTPTAEKVLTQLAETAVPPRAANISETGESGFDEVLSWRQDIAFQSAQGKVSKAFALRHLAGALGYVESYWFQQYATDLFVTSDGRVIRWQSVRLYENSEDRTSFIGLWEWELRRIGPDDFFLAVQRVV